jgi:hypothetical protein
VAREPIAAGEIVRLEDETVRIPAAISIGHKLAWRAISPGEKIIKYGAPIGSATEAIAAGDHVHLHNMKSDYTPTHSLDGARDDHLASSTQTPP